MKHYYFYNYTDKNGNHEVHAGDCSKLPNQENRTYIDYCSNCTEAIAKARKQFPFKSFDGCYFCSKECHTG